MHLLYDPQELTRARAIAVLVPGALARLDMFDPALRWREKGYGLAFYRFPGLDGRSAAPALNIAEAAHEIVSLAERYPDKPIRLLGYSTGGPIVLTAAARLKGDVKVAAMSSAVEHGGGVVTGLRGLYDIVRAALQGRSVNLNTVWYAYYQQLLFGREVLRQPELKMQAEQMIAARRANIVLPDGGKPRAHTDDLRHWRLPPDATFKPDQVRFFWGMADPVFSQRQTLGFARQVGATVTGYPGHGHLLFASHSPVFEDVFAFFENQPAQQNDGIDLTPRKTPDAGAGNSD